MATLQRLSADFRRGSQVSCWALLGFCSIVRHPEISLLMLMRACIAVEISALVPKRFIVVDRGLCSGYNVGADLDHWDGKGGELGLTHCPLWPWASSSRAVLDARSCFSTCSFCKSNRLEFSDEDMCANAHPTHANAFPRRVTLKLKCLSFTVFLPVV